MTRKVTLLLAGVFLFLCNTARADDPVFRWVRVLDAVHTAAVAHAAAGTSVATDKNMNVYVTGWFYDTLTLNPATMPSSVGLRGDNDTISSFLAKYDSSGSFIWGLSLKGPQSVAMAVDRNGSVIIGGSYIGYVDFNPTAGGVSAFISKSGSKDFWLAKFDAAGIFQWARASGGAGEDQVLGIAVDSSGYVYTTGNISGTTAVDMNERNPLTVQFTPTQRDGFIMRYDELGNYNWAVQIAGSGDDLGRGLRVYNGGKLVVTGNTAGAKFRYDATVINGNGGSDLFVAEYASADGALTWAKVFGGTSEEVGYGVAMDDSGYVYAGGSFTSASFSFETGNASSTLTKQNSGTDEDAYMVRLKPDGAFSWAHHLGGNGRELVYSVDLDDSGYIYAAGIFTTTIGMDQTYNSTGGRDIFTLKLNRDNQYLFAKTYGSVDDEERPTIALAKDYSYNLTGGIGNTTRFGVDIDPVTSVDRGLATVNNPGTVRVPNVFFAKFRQANGGVIPGSGFAHSASMLAAVSVFPNPASNTLNLSNAPIHAMAAVYSLSGQSLLQQEVQSNREQLAVSTLSPGTYVLEVRLQDGARRAFRFVKQ